MTAASQKSTFFTAFLNNLFISNLLAFFNSQISDSLSRKGKLRRRYGWRHSGRIDGRFWWGSLLGERKPFRINTIQWKIIKSEFETLLNFKPNLLTFWLFFSLIFSFKKYEQNIFVVQYRQPVTTNTDLDYCVVVMMINHFLFKLTSCFSP